MLTGALALFALPALAACGGNDDDDLEDLPTATGTRGTTTPGEGTATPGGPKLEGSTVTPSGLEYRDEVVGAGAPPRLDQQVTVHYTGWLASNGQEFDSSIGGQPITFSMQGVIRGFTEALSTMKVGGTRTVYIPANLGYANNPPAGSDIPPGADLIFEIELLAIK